MNTMGKILVFIILLLALATAGFHVIDAAIRTNWKKAYDDQEARATAAATNTQIMRDSYAKLQEKYDDLDNKVKQGALFFQQKEKELNEAFNRKQKEADELRERADIAAAGEKVANEERKRLVKESSDLKGRLEVALKDSFDKEVKIAHYRQEAVEAKNERNSVVLRNESLLDQIEALQKTLAKKQFGADSVPLETVTDARKALKAGKLTQAQDILDKAYERASSVASIRDPNAPNPPAGYLEGSITKVDSKDKGLVQISIGSDVGLNEGHTLEVYRLSPKAEYLGRIKIVNVTPHTAIGRLVRSEFTARRSALKEGDKVASRITR
jgi:hypothetical protein